MAWAVAEAATEKQHPWVGWVGYLIGISIGKAWQGQQQWSSNGSSSSGAAAAGAAGFGCS